MTTLPPGNGLDCSGRETASRQRPGRPADTASAGARFTSGVGCLMVPAVGLLMWCLLLGAIWAATR